MEFMDVVRNRRAVREYTGAAVEQSTVCRLIDVAIQAPSAMNLQPWAFGVLLDRNKIDNYGQRAKNWLLENLGNLSHNAAARRLLEDPEFVLFHHAPALVLIMARSSETQAIEDCCLAAENFMLAARSENLGTCWIGFSRPWLNLPAVKEELGVPESYQVVAPIVLGSPRKWPEPHGRKAEQLGAELRLRAC